MKVLLFFVSSAFLFFNTDTIYNVLNDVVEITSSSNSEEVNYSTYRYDNEVENQHEEDLLEDEIRNDSEDEELSLDEDFQNEEDGEYISDDNPVTWDEDPNNYPLETPDTYENIDDEEVQSPTHYREVPEGACAICGDGTYSFSKNRRGTCSRHSGVTEWLR
ncbi:MAG: DUF3761 domain-containing protein [Saprospiraceae bacterium]|nr:DUF3761 domain-containing protein [Saprospiraceae bacterium]